jgi:hypothetical protein
MPSGFVQGPAWPAGHQPGRPQAMLLDRKDEWLAARLDDLD